MQARLASLTRWANETDRTRATQAARTALAAKFAAAPDPEAAMRAHMAAMTFASSRAASRRRTA
jgi:hypothetical protein